MSGVCMCVGGRASQKWGMSLQSCWAQHAVGQKEHRQQETWEADGALRKGGSWT